MLAVIVGVVAILVTRGGDDDPQGTPTTGATTTGATTQSASPTTSTPAPPVVPPFGSIPGASNSTSTTGALSLTQGLDNRVVTQPEFDGLKGCGADSGLTQELKATAWTGRGWVYSCRDVAAAQRVADNLAGYFHAQQFKDIDLGTKTVFATANSAGGTTTVHSVYVSSTAVVFFETVSTDAATAQQKAREMFAAARTTYPSSYPVG